MPEVREADIELRTAQVVGARAGRSRGLSLALAGRLRPGRTARLVLRAPGGGEWLVGMGGEPPAAGVDGPEVSSPRAPSRLR
jgi:hypothetical protein